MGVKGITHVELDATQRNMIDGVARLSRDEDAVNKMKFHGIQFQLDQRLMKQTGAENMTASADDAHFQRGGVHRFRFRSPCSGFSKKIRRQESSKTNPSAFENRSDFRYAKSPA